MIQQELQHQSFQWIFRVDCLCIDWFDLVAVQGTLKSLLQHHSSKASILWRSAFFMVQLSHLSMTTGKTIALTIWIFVGKVISLLLNMLSRFVLIFLPRSCLVGYYKAILHVCNWNSRRRREIFEEMMLKRFQIWLKKISPQIQAAQKTTSRKKTWSKHITVKLLKTQERGNIKSSWDRRRESTAIKHFYWTFYVSWVLVCTWLQW